MNNGNKTPMISLRLTQPPTLSLTEIIRAKPVSIRTQLEMNFEGTKAAIIGIITRYGVQLAAYLHPTKEQVVGCSDIILADYRQLSIDDVELCIRNGIKGLYGEIMRFDTSVICGWLTKYVEEKRQAAMQFKEDIPKKQTGKGEPMPPEVKQGLIDLFKKHGISEPFKRDEERPKGKPYTWPVIDPDSEHYKFATDCLDLFREKWNEQGCTMFGKSNCPWIMYVKGEFKHGFSPDSWLTYCYKLQADAESE